MKQVKEIGYEDYRQCTLFFILKRNLTILITFQMSIIIVQVKVIGMLKQKNKDKNQILY